MGNVQATRQLEVSQSTPQNNRCREVPEGPDGRTQNASVVVQAKALATSHIQHHQTQKREHDVARVVACADDQQCLDHAKVSPGCPSASPYHHAQTTLQPYLCVQRMRDKRYSRSRTRSRSPARTRRYSSRSEHDATSLHHGHRRSRSKSGSPDRRRSSSHGAQPSKDRHRRKAHKRPTSVSGSSSSESSSSDTDTEKRRRKERKHKKHKHGKDKKSKKKSKRRSSALDGLGTGILSLVESELVNSAPKPSENSLINAHRYSTEPVKPPSTITLSSKGSVPLASSHPAGHGRRHVGAPQTREEYEKEQSVVKEVFDPFSGRMRYVCASLYFFFLHSVHGYFEHEIWRIF
ncbi:uncharacterized protein SPPG_04819 [Spizellomyces punctatus DAOM BR117]|uniref:Uncharacterized protein n=1 Tax=Spizellomyces punctatus (strain DAOM BR117) TaxID=645134 RepID=A0A0L0HG96_SPIPD|nr:uncharacterized protein SPPG_04819 [Spizellomyces punctatus DAOM BR117]KND00506.1 hypothetical protein SPPG_04819 [Spizellomyces punctatus DAOM BR117]|eukprot:XP_016608545.1 hypothetical protein SPPG_04819 [Spizellomyces punctatus DAOM BR117]